MVEKYYEELKNNISLRENLSLLKNEIKNPVEKQQLLQIIGDGELLIEFLKEEEPKVRKNAALLLGDLALQQAAAPLLYAYNYETTLFVKSAYLSALGKLDVSEYLTELKKRLQELTGMEPETGERKHINEEIKELEKIIAGVEGIKKHTWAGLKSEHDFLLTTNREQRNATLQETGEVPATVRCKATVHPLGVMIHTSELLPFARQRTYRELLFPLHTSGNIENEPKAAARAVWESDLFELLEECYTEPAPFYFRLEQKSRASLDKKTVFAKKFAAELEQISERKLINFPTDYEVEIRLVETREGTLVAFVKLSGIPVKRFGYRKNAISTSIHPATAALLMELAKPYLQEDAQILDPFCGVGTMLIERDIKVPAKEKYGIDIYGEAIKLARENAAAAGQQINYINRDYFDFKHGYLFDEIITNMPVRGRKTKEEMDAFFAAFFEKSKSILTSGGNMILYTNEEGFVKKQLRLHKEYHLLQEHCIREKEHFYLYIISYKIR